MTVIAYSAKHRVIASDSRCSSAGVHFTTCRKIFRLKSDAMLAISGDVDWRDLITVLNRATPSKLPSREKLADLKTDISALLVFPQGQVVAITIGSEDNVWSGYVLQVEDPIVALGSGAAFAYGAMEHGASPVEAVKIACRRDTACGLPVHWERVGT